MAEQSMPEACGESGTSNRSTGLSRSTSSLPRTPNVGLCLVVVLLGYWLIPRLGIAVVLASLIAIVVASKQWHARCAQRAQRAAHQQLARILAVLAAELQAGATLAVALGHVAELPDISPAYQRIFAAAQRRSFQGGNPAAQLRTHPDLQTLATTLEVAHTRGIAPATLCKHHQRRLETELNYEQTLAAGSQGARVTARILLVLPLVGMAMASILGVDIGHFFRHTLIGGILLLLGTSSAVTGFLWTERIIKNAAHSPS
ncbi:MAG: type II secretion system F family protein [Corynebacterium sp.]|nr:type II secretion system F family protein [Corynebacterium sp.]